MIQPVKLLLDECLGRPLVDDICKVLSWDTPPPTIHHLMDYFKSGTCDSVWIPQIVSEGWIILTGDRGKKSSKMKLPSICHSYKVTHILMSASVLAMKQNQKANAIIGAWDQIKECANAPKGSRFVMRLTHDRRVVIKPFFSPPNAS